MCGINAILDWDGCLPNKKMLVHWMNEQMVYRGPDDEGVYSDALVTLGIRRLSIIDVAGGHQPVYNEDKSIVLVFNGEIYNYVELMRDLKARGHRFLSNSDTETIMHLYEEKGEACLEDLRGMFAFVLWDGRRQRLFAARDRVGIKPLYMAQQNGVLWLSSELKAIVGAARISPTLRPVAVYQFLLYSYAIDQHHTVVEEVKRILPGEYLLADKSGVAYKRYWIPCWGGDQGIADRSDEEILETLAMAVQLHLRSDVPIGILLSGGIDSSAVAAFAARSGHNYTALCAGYTGNHAMDERQQAHATASLLELSYVDVVLDPVSYEADFDELVRYCDEPVGDPAAMPQWSLYRQAQQLGYKVLLSGIGGDEVFFGYPQWNSAGEQSRVLSAVELQQWIGFDQDAGQIRTAKLLDRLSGQELREAAHAANEPLHLLRDQAPPGPDAMASMMFGAYLVHNGCYLADKLGMGCSVEVRVPFLDHKLVQSVFELPLPRRFDPGRSKVMLRRLLRGWVPGAVLDGQKRGFTPPGEYIDRLVTRCIPEILDGHLARSGWIDLTKLRALCSQHAALPWLRRGRVRNLLGIPKSTWLLLRFLAFERWYSELRSLPEPALGVVD
jgi:asparagine synthase (glutamine-hydrolysing)